MEKFQYIYSLSTHPGEAPAELGWEVKVELKVGESIEGQFPKAIIDWCE
jgi:hypothetical protein